MENLLFNTAYVCYTAATILYLAYLFTKREALSRVALILVAVGLSVHLGSLVTRTIVAKAGYWHQAAQLQAEGRFEAALGAQRSATHYVPWSNWFESLSFFAAIISGLFLIIQWNLPMPVLGAFIMPLAWLLMTYALTKDRAIQMLLPALQSYWMAIHVPIMFTSYSILGIAFAVGVAYLIQEHQLKSKRPTELSYRLPPLDDLDDLIYKLILAAFPPLTLGIALGGIWAYTAWGRFWGWDPKETWALITWFMYVIYLHMRLFVGWRGRKTAYLSLAGFAVVLFTYAGVNYLSPLHGFLSGQGR